MIAALVVALLLLLPALKACRWLSAGWLTALSPLWAAYLIVVWTIVLSWLEVTTNLGLLIWAPCAVGMLAFVVAWIDAPDLEEDLELPPAYGDGGLGDRVLELRP
jgi:hypothetical protein